MASKVAKKSTAKKQSAAKKKTLAKKAAKSKSKKPAKKKSVPRKRPAQPAVSHPGMMGDGTEEQNLNETGNPKARITQNEVEATFKPGEPESH